MPAGNPAGYLPQNAKPSSGAKQSSSSRERMRDAARLIPGVAVQQDADRARREAEAARNRRVDPAVQAQRDAATRIARLQQMHAQLVQQGNQADADQVAAIIQSLQPRANPGAGIGAIAGAAGADPRLAARRNAFAGMGSRQ